MFTLLFYFIIIICKPFHRPPSTPLQPPVWKSLYYTVGICQAVLSCTNWWLKHTQLSHSCSGFDLDSERTVHLSSAGVSNQIPQRGCWWLKSRYDKS